MRIFFAFTMLAVLGITPARADATAGPGMCVEQSNGCGGCTQEYCNPPAPDLSVPRDLSLPRDLAPPSDGALDACRERARRRNREQGRGLVLLSGLTAFALFALRRRYKTTRPTPADRALAASDTRSDS